MISTTSMPWMKSPSGKWSAPQPRSVKPGWSVTESHDRAVSLSCRGFHSDNGSEFLNRTVEKLLNKLLIEQTKSRPRHSNDNGLVESKNGAVIRKHMGYTHIAAPHAGRIQRFYQQHFNPYLNFHRPCGQPEIESNAKGKQKRVYRHYQTPWESFEKLPEAASYLKPGHTLEALGRIAQAESDTAAARRMQQAKHKLFASFTPAKTPC